MLIIVLSFLLYNFCNKKNKKKTKINGLLINNGRFKNGFLNISLNFNGSL